MACTVFLVHHFVVFVDVTARTDNVRFWILFGDFCDICFQCIPFAFLYSLVEDADSTDVVGVGENELTVGQHVDFCTATAHVDIHVVAFAVLHLFYVVVVYHLRFFLTTDDFNIDAGFFGYSFGKFLAIFCVAYGGCGASPIVLHIVDFHQLAECFHQPQHFLGFLLRNHAVVENVETQTHRDTQQHFLSENRSAFCLVNVLDQKSYRIGTYVDGGKTGTDRFIFHCSLSYSSFCIQGNNCKDIPVSGMACCRLRSSRVR